MKSTSLSTVAVFVIGLILLAIVIAFIFSSKFRKDVIASEGEAAVLGVINVKGVIIVLLTAIFGGLFVYIIQLDVNSRHYEVPSDASTLEAVLGVLGETDEEVFTLDYLEDSVQINLNGHRIGASPLDSNNTLRITRNPAKNIWDVKNESNRQLGQFELQKGSIAFHEYDSNHDPDTVLHSNAIESHPMLKLRRAEQLNNSSLVFRIDSLRSGNNSQYLVSFGEGDVDYPSEIAWKKARFSFRRTSNGRIKNSDQIKFLSDVKWSYFYYVGLGLGPVKNKNGRADHIDLATIVVLESRFE